MLECTSEWEEIPPQFLSTSCDPGCWTEDIGEGKPEILRHQENPGLTLTASLNTRRCQTRAGSEHPPLLPAARDVGHEDLTAAATPGPPHHPMPTPDLQSASACLSHHPWLPTQTSDQLRRRHPLSLFSTRPLPSRGHVVKEMVSPSEGPVFSKSQ